MSANQISLTPKPGVRDRAKQQAVEILEKWLDAARNGEVEQILVVGSRPDATWFNEWTESPNVPAMMGRLMITMHAMVDKFREAYK